MSKFSDLQALRLQEIIANGGRRAHADGYGYALPVVEAKSDEDIVLATAMGQPVKSEPVNRNNSQVVNVTIGDLSSGGSERFIRRQPLDVSTTDLVRAASEYPEPSYQPSAPQAAPTVQTVQTVDKPVDNSQSFVDKIKENWLLWAVVLCIIVGLIVYAKSKK